MKRIAVLGTFHEAQENGNFQNSEFRKRLAYLTDKFSVTIVLEEWSQNRPPSFTSLWAKERLLPCEDVGTPSEEPFRTFEGRVNHPGHDGTLPADEDAPSLSEYGPLDNQENRETLMVQNIQAKMESHRVGLFVVGVAHVHSMSMKL